MDGGKILGFLAVAGIIGYVGYSRISNRSDTEQQAVAVAVAVVKEVDDYDKHAKWIDIYAPMVAKQAFSANYSMGGRRRAATFDVDGFVAVFFEQLINSARDQGKHDIVKVLIKLRDERGIDRPKS